MNVETIEMDQQVARDHYLDYRKACRRHREAREGERARRATELGKELRQVRVEKTTMEKEDEQLLKAYRELSRGERIIDVGRVIATAGLDAQALPRLALAPAHGEHCWFDTEQDAIRFRLQQSPWRCKKADKVSVRIGSNEQMVTALNDYQWRRKNGHPSAHRVQALVPAIPARFRPDKLDGYFILWEAEWQPCAPTDPLLLKQINDRFYTIVAQWDLTPLEKCVLEGRL